jgi:hypothetical protein
LYGTLKPQYNNEGNINERISVGPDYDFNWVNNNNHNYSDFIHEFDQIHPQNFNDFLLHPPDYNNQLLHPPTQGNIIHRPNHQNSNPPPVRHSFSFLDDNLRNDFIQHPNSSENILEHFRELLRIQKKKKE